MRRDSRAENPWLSGKVFVLSVHHDLVLSGSIPQGVRASDPVCESCDVGRFHWCRREKSVKPPRMPDGWGIVVEKGC